jgi:hypothetical protein
LSIAGVRSYIGTLVYIYREPGYEDSKFRS